MIHWRTTLAGWLLAILNLYVNGTTGKQLVIGAALVVLGTLARDPETRVPQKVDPSPPDPKI